ncbi:MAG: TatD family hydrolase [Chlamydiia bacterium]|nr:TatD family hydrolase [Chlamydiia bacterium]
MNFFDSHAHLSSSDVWPEIDAILERAKGAHVGHILNICTDPATLKRGLLLCHRDPFICNAGATTPHDVLTEGESAFPIFAEAARNKQIVAVGETGLDYHYEHSPKEIQKKFLIRYLHLAAECCLPAIFHCRDAFADLFAIADQEFPSQCKAALHCFTGNRKEAEEVLKRGWYLSFSGILTFKKSEELRAIAKETPLSQLLIETDTPYLAPQSCRGSRNEPAFIVETAACIAQQKGIALQEVVIASCNNAKNLFVR